MLRMILAATFGLAAAAQAGDVPVLPLTPVTVKGPGPVTIGTPVFTGGPLDYVRDFSGVPRGVTTTGTTATESTVARGGPQAVVAPVAVLAAGMTRADRARLAARIEAELAARTR